MCTLHPPSSLSLSLSLFLSAHAISESAHRLDKRGAELPAKPRDEDLDRVRIAIERLRVDVLGQLGLRDDAIAMMHQVRHEPELVAGELDRHAGPRDPRQARVERDRAAAELGLRMAGRAADQRPDPRQHFLDLERLGDVVVGAAVDALDLLVPAGARREHEHWHHQARRAPPAEQRQAVDSGQAEIEQDGVVLFGPGEEIGALAVGRDVDGVAGAGQGGAEVLRQPRLVLDDQQSHVACRYTAVDAEPRLNRPFSPRSAGRL